MRRHGYTEECYFNFTFTAIRGEGGRVEGIFSALIETTYRVLAERRSRLLRELGERTTLASSTDDVARFAVDCLAAQPADVPFCALYLVDETGRQASLAACAGIEADGVAAAYAILLSGDQGVPWPLACVFESLRLEVAAHFAFSFGQPSSRTSFQALNSGGLHAVFATDEP